MEKFIPHPHAVSAEEILERLESSAEGVDPREAQRRLDRFGPNVLKDERRSLLFIYLSQYQSPIVAILILAGMLSYLMEHYTDATFIAGILLINSFLGFYQEYRAETSILALKKLTETHVRVVRGGLDALIPSEEVVTGDIVMLGEGDLVPADVRLIEAHALEVDEAILTGESVPARKEGSSLLPLEALPYERANLLYSGTHVLRGSARGIVVATGEETYLASIAKSAQEHSPHSPLTRSLAVFSKRLAVVLVVLMGAIGIVGVVQGRSVEEMVSITVAELVSAVPEGLPIVVTLILSLGAYRLSRHKVLVRHLPSVESLGSATLIVTDKTGTITEGFLSVQDVEAIDEGAMRRCAALCNDATPDRGDPVDHALMLWVGGEAYETLRAENRRLFYHPFDAAARLMATVNAGDTDETLYVKGAFEALRERAENAPEILESFQRAHDRMAERGLRVLALATSTHGREEPRGWKLTIAGLVGFADGAKSDARDAVAQAKAAGIRVVMVTGDNPITARAIARDVGIWSEGEGLISGKEIEGWDDARLAEALTGCSVVARALPEHKYRIVKLLQERGEIVAVTGDGVNDVPALKAADLGIAMGGGSEAAKSTAKMVITDNRLGVIVDAVRQGRIIAANLRKVVFYLVATCFDEIIVISGAIAMGLPLPIHPTQVLWINLVTDGVLDKTFPMCKEEGNVMALPPRKPENQFFARPQIARTAWVSFVNAAVALSAFYFFLSSGHSYEEAVTVAFCIIVSSQWVNGILAQKENEPFLQNPHRSVTINPAIWIGVGIGIVLQGCALWFFPQWLHAVTPTPQMLGWIGAGTMAVFVLIEGYKWAEWGMKKRSF